MPALALPQVCLRPLQGCHHSIEPLVEVGGAEGRKLERAHAARHLGNLQPKPAQRVFQKADERDRRAALRHRLQDEVEKGAKNRARERLAAQVFGHHAERLEPGGNAPRQRAIGRDERRGHLGRLGDLSQNEGDGLRLVLGVWRLQDGEAGQRFTCPAPIGLGEVAVPALGGPGRAHGLAHELGAPIRTPRKGRPGQGQHLLAAHSQRIDELPEPELRVLGVLRHDCVPACRVEGLVEPRQHECAVRQARDHAQQLGDHGCAAHHAGDDHRRCRRRLPPKLRLRQHQGLVALHLGDATLLGQVCRPVLGDDFQERERLAPMLGERVGHEGAQARPVNVLDLHRIHQPRQLAGELGSLCRRARGGRRVKADVGLGPAAATPGLCPREHQLGERQPALDLADRRGNLGGALGARVLDAGEQGCLFPRADDRPDLRHQQRRAARSLEECLLQPPRRPPGRQQEGDVGEFEGPGPGPAGGRQIPGEQRLRQRSQERPARRHRVDAPRRSHGRAARLSFSLEELHSGTAPLLPAPPVCRRASTRLPCAPHTRGPPQSPCSTPG